MCIRPRYPDDVEALRISEELAESGGGDRASGQPARRQLRTRDAPPGGGALLLGIESRFTSRRVRVAVVVAAAVVFLGAVGWMLTMPVSVGV